MAADFLRLQKSAATGKFKSRNSQTGNFAYLVDLTWIADDDVNDTLIIIIPCNYDDDDKNDNDNDDDEEDDYENEFFSFSIEEC